MARNNRARKKVSNDQKVKNAITTLHEAGYTVLTDAQVAQLKNGITDFVMNRAYVMVMSAFIDNAKTMWKDLFKSKKAMRKYLKKSIDDVELHGQWISEEDALHFDDLTDWLYQEFGVDYRTAWIKSENREEIMDGLKNKEHPDYWSSDSNWRSKIDEDTRSVKDIIDNAASVQQRD